jgi:hypothetical protein
MRRWPAGSHPLALALTSVTPDVPASGMSSVVDWWERRRWEPITTRPHSVPVESDAGVA